MFIEENIMPKQISDYQEREFAQLLKKVGIKPEAKLVKLILDIVYKAYEEGSADGEEQAIKDAENIERTRRLTRR